MDKFYELMANSTDIADFGGGINGSWSYNNFFPQSSVDIYDMSKNTREDQPPNIKYHRADVTKLYKNNTLHEKYDLIFCEHVYEHVDNPESLSFSINKALKQDGYLHVSVPDATNFTDIFYRLIFPMAGGHIQKFTKDGFIDLITEFGFKLIGFYPMADSWTWFENSYSIFRNNMGKQDMDNTEFQFLADTFKKELTIDKGYFYGWCFLFQKTHQISYEAVDQDTEIELIKISPEVINQETGCNVQPNGMSAIAIECCNANNTTLVLWNGNELDTCFVSDGYLTALVPNDFIKVGHHEIQLLDYSCNKYSAASEIHVVENEESININE